VRVCIIFPMNIRMSLGVVKHYIAETQEGRVGRLWRRQIVCLDPAHTSLHPTSLSVEYYKPGHHFYPHIFA